MKGKKSAIIFGLYFLLLVTTYSSFSYIITLIYEQEKLTSMGPVLLLSNYATFLVVNTFAPSIRLSSKTQLKIGALLYLGNYLLQIFTGLLPVESAFGIMMSIVGAMMGGFGASMIWVCYGGYMEALIKQNKEEQETGKYFSLLNSLTFSNNLLGGIITTFGLGLFNNFYYFMILSILGAGAFCICFFMTDVDESERLSTKYECKKELKNVFYFYSSMKPIILLLALDGLMLGFTSTTLSKMLPEYSSPEQQKLRTGISLMIFGVGNIVGGYFSGKLPDTFTIQLSGKIGIAIFAFCCVYTIVQLQFRSFFFGVLGSFMWAISLSYLQGWLYVLCCVKYQGKLESFAVCKQIHSIFFCLFQIYLIIDPTPSLDWVLGIFAFISIPGFFCLNYLKSNTSHNKQIHISINNEDSL